MKNWPLYRWGWDKGKLHCTVKKRQPTFPPILTQGQFCMMCLTEKSKPNSGIHRSDTSNHWQMSWTTFITSLQCNALLGNVGPGIHADPTWHEPPTKTPSQYTVHPPGQCCSVMTVVVPQQDSAPCHTIKTAQEFPTECDKEMEALTWLPNCPAPNPVKQVRPMVALPRGLQNSENLPPLPCIRNQWNNARVWPRVESPWIGRLMDAWSDWDPEILEARSTPSVAFFRPFLSSFHGGREHCHQGVLGAMRTEYLDLQWCLGER